MRCKDKRRINCRRLTIALVCVVVACAPRSKESFVKSLRCGMTQSEVSRLARNDGYDNSDQSWLSRAVAKKRPKELTLLDLTFHAGRLVAVRLGSYDPRTKQVTYRSINLCSPRPRH
jgi:hypothetical protein